MPQIIATDAGAGISYLQTLYPGVDYAAWGGTVFARTLFDDPTYFDDYSISLVPGGKDCDAILFGQDGAIRAVGAQVEQNLFTSPSAALNYMSQGFSSLKYLDTDIITNLCAPSNGANLGNGTSFAFDDNGNMTVTTSNADGSTNTTIFGAANAYVNLTHTSSNGTDIFISGTGAVDNVNGAAVLIDTATSATVNGSSDTFYLNANSGGSDVVGLAGIGTNATVLGTGYVGLTSSDESLALVSSGATAATAAGMTGETISASGATVYLDAGSAGTIYGNGTNIGLMANSGSLPL